MGYLQKNAFFLSPYVCPEPVLVKLSVEIRLVKKWPQKGVLRTDAHREWYIGGREWIVALRHKEAVDAAPAQQLGS